MSDEREGDELVQKLAELAKKKESEPPPELTNDVIINLAGMTPLQYAQQIAREAKKYKTPVKLLEKAVEAVKVEQETEKLLEPHWEVTPAEEPVDAAKLFTALEARILLHVAMPQDLAFVVSLWIGQSWIHEHATYSPILFVTSAERDSGKTTLMGIIGFLARRSLLSVGISAAALYRSIEKWHPSFVIDEADEAFVDNPDLRQVVNSGWTRGQGVVRCDPDTNEPRKFSTFCPKAIAVKGKRAPDTILSRAIFVTLKRRTKDEAVAHFNHVDDDGFARLRGQLARWAADNGKILGLERPDPAEGFINRSASNWQLMLAIADTLGEEAGKRARKVAQQIAGITDLSSAGVALLEDIKVMFRASTLDYLTSKAIVQGLTADAEKRWAEWSHGRPITEKGVAGLLHEYLISSKTVGPKGAEAKGYRKADFVDVWGRYLEPKKEAPPSDPDNLPSSRRTPCNGSAFAENSAVEAEPVRRENFDGFSSTINTIDVSTGKNPDTAPSPEFSSDFAPADDGLELPPLLRRCAHCGRGGAVNIVGLPDGRQRQLHRDCEGPWFATHDNSQSQQSPNGGAA
jgi:putative DNA primase/helicase